VTFVEIGIGTSTWRERTPGYKMMLLVHLWEICRINIDNGCLTYYEADLRLFRQEVTVLTSRDNTSDVSRCFHNLFCAVLPKSSGDIELVSGNVGSSNKPGQTACCNEAYERDVLSVGTIRQRGNRDSLPFPHNTLYTNVHPFQATILYAKDPRFCVARQSLPKLPAFQLIEPVL
jgi:hypothetical protein